MSNVVNLNKGEPVRGPEATSEIIKWLREYADKLEKGDARPACKAVLLLYEDRGEQFRVATAYYNATTLERAGMLSLSLRDTVDVD